MTNIAEAPAIAANPTQVCAVDLDEDSIGALFGDEGTTYLLFYSTFLPTFTAVGLVFNLMAFIVFHHRDMRGLCTMFMTALLFADCLQLVCLTLVYYPRAHISNTYTVDDCADQKSDFWAATRVAQDVFVWALPLEDSSQCLVIWYSLALVAEQYCVLHHPIKLSQWSSRDAGIKMIITIFNLTVLIHLIHFFKFIPKPYDYGHVEHYTICLSDMYRAKTYRNYELYLYPICFVILPWVITIYALISVVVEILRRRKEGDSKNDPSQYPEQGMIRLFKGGRSRRQIIAVTTVNVLSNMVCVGVYIGQIINKSETSTQSNSWEDYVDICHFAPMDHKFENVFEAEGLHTEEVRLIFVVVNVINSSMMFIVCYAFGSAFRDIVNGFVHKKFAKVKVFCRIFLVFDFRRRQRAPPSTTEESTPRTFRTVTVERESPSDTGRKTNISCIEERTDTTQPTNSRDRLVVRHI